MSRGMIVNLSDCSEFRQTLAARPPAMIHGTVVLLLILLGAALTWAAVVEANLVVRAKGRVRPIETTTRVFTAFGSELDGRVAEASVDEGDVVRRGDILARIDTGRLDNRMAKLERTIQALEEELAEIRRLDTLLAEQFASARDKARAELTQSEADLARATRERESEIRGAQAELDAAKDHWSRCKTLRAERAITEAEIVEAETKVRRAAESLVQARLPVSQDQVAVYRRALDLVERDFAVRRAELGARNVVKQGEAEAARKELANLAIQREEAVLVAPIDGVVVTGRIQKGDVLESGKAVVELAPQKGYRFEAVVPSEDVGQLQVGMPVQIKFDAYDYQKYGVLEGAVTYLSPDSKVNESNDAPSVAAYIVRIELHGDEVARGKLRGKVKLGIGGTAEIITGRESVLEIFVKRIRQTISLG